MYVSRSALGAFPKKLQAAVRSGDLVTIKVIKKLHGDNWQISFKGKLLAVKSEVPLSEGRSYRGHVFLSDSTIRFRVQDREDRGPLSGKYINDNIHRKVLETLQRTGMPAAPETIEYIAAKAQKMQKFDHDFLKLAVLLMDKGIELENEQELAAFPFAVQEKRKRGGDREDEHDRDQDDGKAEKRKAPLKEQMKRIISGQIKGFIRGYESQLQLFNHIISPHENWIILPLHITIDGKELEGTLRLKIRSPAEKPEALALVVTAGGYGWGFAVEQLRAKEPVMKVYSSDLLNSAALREQMELFSKKLTKLGIKVDDSINNGSLFDGFTEITKKGVKSIDTFI